MFKTKSVDSKIEPRKDGFRILAARGRGRGLPSDRYDIWMANLGPSEQLRDAILSGKITWKEYSRRYLDELGESDGIDRRNRQIKNHGQKFTLRLPAASGQDANRYVALPLRRGRTALPPAFIESVARRKSALKQLSRARDRRA